MHEWITIALMLALAVLLVLWWVERMPSARQMPDPNPDRSPRGGGNVFVQSTSGGARDRIFGDRQRRVEGVFERVGGSGGHQRSGGIQDRPPLGAGGTLVRIIGRRIVVCQDLDFSVAEAQTSRPFPDITDQIANPGGLAVVPPARRPAAGQRPGSSGGRARGRCKFAHKRRKICTQTQKNGRPRSQSAKYLSRLAAPRVKQICYLCSLPVSLTANQKPALSGKPPRSS